MKGNKKHFKNTKFSVSKRKKKLDLNLIKPLDPASNLQKIQRTKKSVKLQYKMKSVKSGLWENLQDKRADFFNK